MRRNFIIDEEIELLDETDFLNTKVYAHTLQKIIQNAPPERPFTIGLFGEWGSGKSSIIKTVKEELKKKNDFKVKFAVFDAWKYSEDAFRRSFILSLSKELNIDLPKQEYNLYQNQTQRINDFKIQVSTRTWVTLGLFLLALLLSYMLIPWVRTQALALVSLISLYLITSTLFISLKAIINKDILVKTLAFIQSLVYSKYDEERPLMFSPEQFSKAFEHIIDNATLGMDRLVIVIDNIDRCEKHYSTELLSTIKGFLESREKVLFILPVDETALKRHIRDNHKANDKEADEFLRKFFNVTLKIKLYHSSEIYEFAKKINEKFTLGFSNYTIDLVSKEFASNPRRIIQMFNNLSAELECFSDESFIKTYETVICKLLILREEFPVFYNDASKNPYLLNMSIEEIKQATKIVCSQNLENFLNKTRVISEMISIKELNLILSNSIVFSSLPSEIEDFIENVQFEEIKKFINTDKSKLATVVDYVIKQLEINRERQLIGNTFINYLNTLIEIDEEYSPERTVDLRIEEIIKPVLDRVFYELNHMEKLITYSWSLHRRQRPYIIDHFVSKMNEEIAQVAPGSKWVSSLKLAVNLYEDKRILKKLAVSFRRVYEIDRNVLNPLMLSQFQITSLISQEFYFFIIQKIASLENNDLYYVDLKFLLEKDKPILQVGVELINKINVLYPDLFAKKSLEITEILHSINSLLSILKIDFSESKEGLQILTNLIFSDRKIPNAHPGLANSRPHDSIVSYVDEIMSGHGEAYELLDFCFNVYRVSISSIGVTTVLEKFVVANKFQGALNSRFLDLRDKGIILTPLYTIIIKSTIYNGESLSLIKDAFFTKQNAEYLIADELVVAKLNELLNLIYVDDSHSSIVESFLVEITNDSRTKRLLTTLISGHGKESILKLPNSLQLLAIDVILESGKIFDFSNNIDFLKVIAQNGNERHIAELVNDVMIKLQHADELDTAISIISEIKHINKNDANRIIHELENKRGDVENKDDIKAIIKHLTYISNK
jgi:hypothetical protein